MCFSFQYCESATATSGRLLTPAFGELGQHGLDHRLKLGPVHRAVVISAASTICPSSATA